MPVQDPVQNESADASSRNSVALGTLAFAAFALTALATVSIVVDGKNGMTILNMVLPVVASWVGTVLAFYFGRANFESASRQIQQANQQVQEIARLSSEERAKTRVNAVMRRLPEIVHVPIPRGKSDQDIPIAEMNKLFTDTITRIPVTDADEKPKYMIHQSSIALYITGGGKETDSLETFITKQKSEKPPREYGLNKGFVVVSEKATLDEAKRKMEQAAGCQDIFITQEGSPDQPLTGWISNVRMAKFLEA